MNLHKKMTQKDLDKLLWMVKAASFLENEGYMDWEEATEYVESLYYNYVEVVQDYDADPIEVVKEDLTYWSD